MRGCPSPVLGERTLGHHEVGEGTGDVAASRRPNSASDRQAHRMIRDVRGGGAGAGDNSGSNTSGPLSSDLRENRGSPIVLFEIARAYFSTRD